MVSPVDDELEGAQEAFATHQRLAEEEERKRFGVFLLAGAASTLALSFAVFVTNGWRPALVGVVLAALQLLARHLGCQPQRLRLRRWLKHGTLLGYLLMIVGLGLLTGQGHSFVLWFLVLLPVMAAFVNTPPTAGLWAALATLAALAVWASEYWIAIPERLPTTPELRGVTRLLLILVVAAISIRVRQTSDMRIRELSQTLVKESIAKRLAEHHRQAAEEAQRKAEAADAAKTRILAFMSHEIRTPLHGVLGLTALLRDTPLNAEQARFVELAKNSGEILLSLINDFLDFSRLEAQRLELESMVFSPCRLLEEKALLLRESARQKGIALEYECTAPGGVRGDEARVGQILLNLLGNAIKFTHAGRVVLRCTMSRRTPAQLWLRFEVEDTGIGIPAGLQQSLFLPFTQADASTTRRYGGSGLGLAICKSLTEAMGGRLGVESTVGRGSLFWVELPFIEVAEAQWPQPQETDEDAADAAPAAGGGRVLLVEDNPVNQLMAAEMLKRLGYAVATAGNGEEAVAAVRQQDFDLVLMDCDMPLMDGFEATREIRREEAAREYGDGEAQVEEAHLGEPHLGQPHVPVVAMTAAALRGDRERCLAAGMDDYLAKPVRMPELRRTLRKWIRPAGAGEGAPGSGR